MKKAFWIILGCLFLLMVGIGTYALFQFRDRHPNYQIDLKLYAGPGTLEGGFAKVDITPSNFETWEDVNGNSKFDPESGDRFIDKNGNGKFALGRLKTRTATILSLSNAIFWSQKVSILSRPGLSIAIFCLQKVSYTKGTIKDSTNPVPHQGG